MARPVLGRPMTSRPVTEEARKLADEVQDFFAAGGSRATLESILESALSSAQERGRGQAFREAAEFVWRKHCEGDTGIAAAWLHARALSAPPAPEPPVQEIVALQERIAELEKREGEAREKALEDAAKALEGVSEELRICAESYHENDLGHPRQTMLRQAFTFSDAANTVRALSHPPTGEPAR